MSASECKRSVCKRRPLSALESKAHTGQSDVSKVFTRGNLQPAVILSWLLNDSAFDIVINKLGFPCISDLVLCPPRLTMANWETVMKTWMTKYVGNKNINDFATYFRLLNMHPRLLNVFDSRNLSPLRKAIIYYRTNVFNNDMQYVPIVVSNSEYSTFTKLNNVLPEGMNKYIVIKYDEPEVSDFKRSKLRSPLLPVRRRS